MCGPGIRCVISDSAGSKTPIATDSAMDEFHNVSPADVTGTFLGITERWVKVGDPAHLVADAIENPTASPCGLLGSRPPKEALVP